MGVSINLETYSLNSVNEGIEALATTRVTISPKEDGPNDAYSTHSQTGISKDRKFSGAGSDTDIIVSSARAYVSAINKLLSWSMRRNMNGIENERDFDQSSDAVLVVGESPTAVV